MPYALPYDVYRCYQCPKVRQHALIKKIFGQTVRMLQPKVLMECLFLRGTISKLGTLFYTTLRLKKFYRIGPWESFTDATSISFCYSTLKLFSALTCLFLRPCWQIHYTKLQQIGVRTQHLSTRRVATG